MERAYEILNPSFRDMSLQAQIEAGINDWCAESDSGHPFFGRTQKEAEELRASFA